jgi:hypothetical protein
MTSIISKEAAAPGFTVEKMEAWGLATATAVGGMIAAHVALKAMKKQDNLIFTGSATVAGIAGAIMLKPGWLKLLSLGFASYGLLRSANVIVKEATEPGNTGAAGLSGFIPEGIKSKIRSFLPNLGGLGNIGDTLLGDDDLSGMPNLDDVAGVEDVGYVDVSEQQGIGNTML